MRWSWAQFGHKPHPTYSITWSARASTYGGIVRPSALAVLRLITSSNCVGCSIGSSPALAPLRILSTNSWGHPSQRPGEVRDPGRWGQGGSTWSLNKNCPGHFMHGVRVTEGSDVDSMLSGRSQESRPVVVIVQWPSAWRS